MRSSQMKEAVIEYAQEKGIAGDVDEWLKNTVMPGLLKPTYMDAEGYTKFPVPPRIIVHDDKKIAIRVFCLVIYYLQALGYKAKPVENTNVSWSRGFLREIMVSL